MWSKFIIEFQLPTITAKLVIFMHTDFSDRDVMLVIVVFEHVSIEE